MTRDRDTEAYVHVFRDRAVIYLGLPGQRHPTPPPVVIDMDGATLQVLTDRLAVMGWVLGTDGWRAPLDPTSRLIATAHLMPRCSIEPNGQHPGPEQCT